MGLDAIKDNEDIESVSDSSDDEEEWLVDVPLSNYNSNLDEEKDHTRNIMAKYVKLKKTIQEDANKSGTEHGDGWMTSDKTNGEARRTRTSTPAVEIWRLLRYESYYIKSLDP